MEIVSILRALRRHRVLATLGIVPAMIAMLALVYQISVFPPKLASRTQHSGSAAARVLLSAGRQATPQIGAAVSESLGTRAVLMADLMATAGARKEIAKRAGVEPGEIAVFGPASGRPPLEIPLAVQASEAAGLAYEPYVLTLRTDGDVPIIALRATGRDAAGAAQVVEAGVAALAQQLSDPSTNTASLRLDRLGPPVRSTAVKRASIPAAIIAGAVVFVGWCSGIVLLSGLRRRRTRVRPVEATTLTA